MDRELYDLCRRYNYYYRKYRDTKELSYKYYDESLNDVVRKMGCDLSIHEANLIECILKKLDLDKGEVEIEAINTDACYDMFGNYYLSRGGNIKILIKNNEKFLNALQRLMMRRKL